MIEIIGFYSSLILFFYKIYKRAEFRDNQTLCSEKDLFIFWF
jgi:hypothetical protein